MKRIHPVLFFCTALCFCLVPFSFARACTIWAATGEDVISRGSLIAKNRDNLSHLYTILKNIHPDRGFPFYGLFDIEADGYVTAGINIKGLAVVNASANSVPKIKRHTATEDLTQRLLTSFSSVDNVLSEKNLFQKSYPAIYIIGDASKIASIEIAPGGMVSIAVKEEGVLALTNHYTNPELAYANEQPSSKSLMRLGRIQSLLSRGPVPFGLDDFVTFSSDRNGTSDEALWRPPAAPGTIRTLASWIIHMPPLGPSILYVRLANNDEPEKILTITLDSAFWTKNTGTAQ